MAIHDPPGAPMMALTLTLTIALALILTLALALTLTPTEDHYLLAKSQPPI